MNEDKLKDHSVDALVLLGLANSIRSYKMMSGWDKKNNTASKGWWARAMSTNAQVKMATTDFHFSDIEDAEKANRTWEFTKLWYWQYRLLKRVRGDTVQATMLVLLGVDQVSAVRMLAASSKYLSE